MEVPFLACSSVLSLNEKISTDVINVSSFSHHGNNMEVFFNIESELSVVVTLGWVFLPVFLVDKIPLLVYLTIVFPHVDVSVFGINTT